MFDVARIAPALVGALLLAFCTIVPAAAQTAAAKKGADQEQIIVTQAPAQQSRVRAFLNKVLGKLKGKKLETTGSEVWTVPKGKAEQVKKRLSALGAKVTKLREDFNKLLRPKPPKDLTPNQREIVDTVSKDPETVNVGVLSMPDADSVDYALTRFEQQVGTKGQAGPEDDRYAKVLLPISATRDIALVRTRDVDKTEKGYTWVGETEETGERAVLMLWRDGHLSGYFGYKGRVFVVKHMGGDVHAMAELDPAKLPPDHAISARDKDTASEKLPPKVAEPKVAAFADAERKTLEAKPIVIDVMLLYTPRAARHYVRDLSDLTALAIEQSNETFRNSGISNVSLRLVHTEQIDFDEKSGDQFTNLYEMVDGKGPFKDVRKLRDEKHADIVGLIVHDPDGCGLSTRVGADADEAYFIVHHSCAAITYSIAHEIGHILGARHDRAVDSNETPFAFAHGYVNGTKWRDMMSYREGCGGCPRIPYWSNPRVLYKGEPTGTTASDNARVILENAQRVANFR